MCLGSLDFRKVRTIRSILDESINDLITNHRDVLCNDPLRDFIRSRSFTPEKIIRTLLSFGSKNTESELIEIVDDPGTTGNINAAFLQQRRKFTDKCMPFLFDTFTSSLYAEQSLGLNSVLVNGYRILAADGSDVNVAYNPNDPLTYIAKKNKKGYNQIHLNAISDIGTGLWVAASVQGIHKKQERRAFVDMLSQLHDPEKAILTADRGYECFNTFAACIEAGAKFVIRIKDIASNGIISAYDLPDSEFDTYIHTVLTNRRTKETRSDPDKYTISPFYTEFDFFDESGEYEIEFRIVRIKLPNGEYVVLATNLDEDEFNLNAIAHIYELRWGCEVSFRKLKHSIGLVNFHSWKMEFVMQELYARLIYHNFCAAIIHVLSPKQISIDGKTDASKTDDAASCTRKIRIAFSQAVTECRKLIFNCTRHLIEEVINTVRKHVQRSRAGQSAERTVKPQSNRPFGYKGS